MHQLNLLPPSRRLHLKREVMLVTGSRFAHSVVFGLGGVTAAGIALVIGLWAASFMATRSTEVELSRYVGDYVTLKNEINEQNDRLEVIDNIGKNRLLWSAALSRFIQVVPQGTEIEEITGLLDKAEMAVSGVALTRNSLVVFEERLSSLPWVTNIDAPRSNLLKRNKPYFTFTLTINPAQITRGSNKDD